MRINELKKHDCQTPGATFSTKIKSNSIGVTIKLPDGVSVGDITDKQGDKFDDMMHDAMEKIVTKIIHDTNKDSKALWDKARKNDLTEEYSFKNELDNQITVDVYKKEIDNIPGVMIYISGPDSESENHITMKEAEMIYLGLKDIFDPK